MYICIHSVLCLFCVFRTQSISVHRCARARPSEMAAAEKNRAILSPLRPKAVHYRLAEC